MKYHLCVLVISLAVSCATNSSAQVPASPASAASAAAALPATKEGEKTGGVPTALATVIPGDAAGKSRIDKKL